MVVPYSLFSVVLRSIWLVSAMMSRAAMYCSMSSIIGATRFFSFFSLLYIAGRFKSSRLILPQHNPSKSSVFRSFKISMAPSRYTWSLQRPPGLLVSYTPRFTLRTNFQRLILSSMQRPKSSNSSTNPHVLALKAVQQLIAERYKYGRLFSSQAVRTSQFVQAKPSSVLMHGLISYFSRFLFHTWARSLCLRK